MVVGRIVIGFKNIKTGRTMAGKVRDKNFIIETTLKTGPSQGITSIETLPVSGSNKVMLCFVVFMYSSNASVSFSSSNITVYQHHLDSSTGL